MTAETGMDPGQRIVGASWAGTALFVVTAGAAAGAPGTLQIPAFIIALALSVAGCVSFAWAYFVAVGRSRKDEIAVAGLFLLMGGSAAPRTRRHLLGSLALEVVAAVATAAARPYTSLAFGVLVPLYGLGLAGLWAARHGTFGPRLAPQTSRRKTPNN